MPTPPTSTPWVPMWPLAAGAAGASLTYKGDWVAGTYNDGDVVVKDGIAYMALGGPTTDVPDSAPWGLAQAAATIGTSLPASPVDGQEFVLVDSLTAPTYAWTFKYNASVASANKWLFIGGAPRNISIATDETSAATGWTDLTTVGPNFTAPRAGDYYVSANALLYGTGSPNNSLNIGVTVGATTPANPCISQGIGATGQPANIGVPLALSGALLAGVPAGGDIRMRYEFSVVTGHALRRNLSVTPVRVA